MSDEGPSKEKLGSLKPKFAPTIPSTKKRVKRETPVAPAQTKGRGRRERQPNRRFQPQEATASGPFALGPAARPGASSSSSSAPRASGGTSRGQAIPKASSSAARQIILSDVEDDAESTESEDGGFDDQDPLIPQQIHKRSDKLNMEEISHKMLRLKADASATASLSPVKREGETLGSDDAKRFSSELVFLQFPPILPDSLLKPATVFNGIKAEMLKDTKGKSKSKIVPGAEDTPMDGQVSTQKEGRIGKLKVLKSGRMVMSVGDLSFEVAQGPGFNLYQNLVWLNDDGQEACMLGDVQDRLICTPVIR